MSVCSSAVCGFCQSGRPAARREIGNARAPSRLDPLLSAKSRVSVIPFCAHQTPGRNPPLGSFLAAKLIPLFAATDMPKPAQADGSASKSGYLTHPCRKDTDLRVSGGECRRDPLVDDRCSHAMHSCPDRHWHRIDRRSRSLRGFLDTLHAEPSCDKPSGNISLEVCMRRSEANQRGGPSCSTSCCLTRLPVARSAGGSRLEARSSARRVGC